MNGVTVLGITHMAFAVRDVDDIEAALQDAQRSGATLKECAACKTTGSHAHPEGWVAFLEDDGGGVEIESMRVDTPEELERDQHGQGI